MPVTGTSDTMQIFVEPKGSGWTEIGTGPAYIHALGAIDIIRSATQPAPELSYCADEVGGGSLNYFIIFGETGRWWARSQSDVLRVEVTATGML